MCLQNIPGSSNGENSIVIKCMFFDLPKWSSGLARWAHTARRIGSTGREFNLGKEREEREKELELDILLKVQEVL